VARPAGPAAPRTALDTPKEIASFDSDVAHSKASIRFSPQAHYVLVASDHGSWWRDISLYDLQQKKLLATMDESIDSPRFHWSADDRYIVGPYANARPVLSFDVSAAKVTKRDDKQEQDVNAVAMSPDGKSVVLGFGAESDEAETALLVVDAATLADVGPKWELRDANVAALAMSPDGKTLAISYKERSTRQLALLDPATLESKTKLEEEQYGSGSSVDNQLGFSPDGQMLFTSGRNPWSIWSLVGTPKPLRTSDSDALEGTQPVGFAGNGMFIVSTSYQGYSVYDIATDKIRHHIQTDEIHENAVIRVLSPDKRRMVSGGSDGTIVLWDVLDNKHGEPVAAHETKIIGAGFSSDGRFLATVDGEGLVKIWILSGEGTSGQ
jgi:WD40 repeat protein